MGVLSRKVVIALLLANASSHSALAEVPTLLSGVTGTLTSEAGWGSIYSAGASLQLNLGSDDDESNHSGELHGSYVNQLAPLNPGSSDTSTKHTFNWSGGGTVSTWPNGTFGIDLDSVIDPLELLNTDGFKFSLAHSGYKASYRYARNVINGSFLAGPPTKQYTAQGAFFYQQTFGLEGDFELGEHDTVSAETTYSLFSPSAPEFANLLGQNNLASIASFQDTLQSLEQWSLSIAWKHQFEKDWDVSAQGRLAHLIIPGIASYETSLGLGYSITQPLHAQVTWNYTNETSVLVQNVIQFELRYSWSPQSKEEPVEDEPTAESVTPEL